MDGPHHAQLHLGQTRRTTPLAHSHQNLEPAAAVAATATTTTKLTFTSIGGILSSHAWEVGQYVHDEEAR